MIVNFGSGDGTDPYGSLTMGANGQLYGTTLGGGAYSDGTVFEVALTPELPTLVPAIVASALGVGMLLKRQGHQKASRAPADFANENGAGRPGGNDAVDPVSQ
jgi:uncharacterized repeat protein (TIGR03803 family)